MLRATKHAAETYNPPVSGWIDETLAPKDSATGIPAARKDADGMARRRALPCEKAMTSKATSPLTGGAQHSGRFDEAYRVLEEAIAAQAFPGCSFGVLAAGETVLEGALGRFTYEADAPAVTAGTVFDLASVTKVVATTAVAMLLFQRGKLDLEMPLGELLPGFIAGQVLRRSGAAREAAALARPQLGPAGICGDVPDGGNAGSAFQGMLSFDLEAEPGTRAEYSDPGFILLGKALEVIAGERLDSWAQREVFHPLGMQATGFCPPQALRSLIPPTEEDTSFRHRRIQGEVQDENAFVLGGVAGHAGLFSNVADLLRFAREILAAGQTSRAPMRICSTGRQLSDLPNGRNRQVVG